MNEQGFVMGRSGKKNELAGSRVQIKALPVNATRKSRMGYVDRMCFDNWKKTTCLLCLCKNVTL